MTDMFMPTEREFGVLSERVENVQRDMSDMRQELKGNTVATAEILRRISAIDGGWKVLVGISAIISAGIGLAIKFLPHLLP